MPLRGEPPSTRSTELSGEAFVDAFMEWFSDADDDDPYLAIYPDDVQSAIVNAAPERLRFALASVLEYLPQAGSFRKSLPRYAQMTRGRSVDSAWCLPRNKLQSS